MQTLVFGFCAQPQASYEELLETAANLGVSISAQDLAARLDERAANCLYQVLQAVIRHVICTNPHAILLLDRFSAFSIQDSTPIALPDGLATV